MKTFGQFLVEARGGSLYHGTTLHSAELIVQDNTIKMGKADSSHPIRNGTQTGVSLSRSIQVATARGDRHSENCSAVFELDQNKLTHNYRIEPYNYFSRRTRRKETLFKPGYYNEYEEYVPADIKNLNRYLIAIHLYASNLLWLQPFPTVLSHPKAVIHINENFR